MSKVDYIIVDKFVSVKFVVWGKKKNINVDVNKFYLFINISVCIFNDVKYLIIIKYIIVK